ncbi:DUF3168 domain-containing protein [Ancylobacter pratisalsi]|uniref:DUF3168 domain-containing protein n=1 Tax=Ancylobacter pratisalsi TaxID=1745854 RepID=A0A6P1YH73_9HYPH|nr:DUF3168 domain-containing protein [Ancylobacter pratisalsi]QIB32637.1 DUF3168 domain-containing protein [Ancylobacter pratisalsi]
MSDGSWDLQKAVYEVLAGGASPAVGVPVLADAPQDTPVPYVELGDSDTVPDDVQCVSGLEETITLHVWTSGGSRLQAKEIISDIRLALHLKDLAVSGRHGAHAVITATRLYADGDNDEFVHGVVTLRVNHYGPEEG